MVKRRGFRFTPRIRNQKNIEFKYLLESGTIHDMQEAKAKMALLLRYHWNYYSELAYQRNAVKEELLAILNEKAV